MKSQLELMVQVLDELTQSARADIERQQRQLQTSTGRVVAWDEAEQEWLRDCFLAWKGRNWQALVSQADRQASVNKVIQFTPLPNPPGSHGSHERWPAAA